MGGRAVATVAAQNVALVLHHSLSSSALLLMGGHKLGDDLGLALCAHSGWGLPYRIPIFQSPRRTDPYKFGHCGPDACEAVDVLQASSNRIKTTQLVVGPSDSFFAIGCPRQELVLEFTHPPGRPDPSHPDLPFPDMACL